MTLSRQARAALAGPGAPLPVARTGVPARPGLYAIHGDAAAWEQLGLGRPPDARPLYVGKAEGSLASRDVGQHFGIGSTGSSTLRRSLAALLRTQLGLAAVPRNRARPARFANYALTEANEARLTVWMERHLTLAVWVPGGPGDLGVMEGELLHGWQPPLNLARVRTPWTRKIRAARRVMATQARAAAAADAPLELVPGGLPLNRKERYYTGTVLPMLVAADDFAHLGRLTALAGLGPVEVDARPGSATVQLFTEYGYLESRLQEPTDPTAPTTRDTPDVVVFLTSPRRVLLVIEAKLFDRPTRTELGQQLTAQATLVAHLARDRDVAADDVAHVLLLPDAPAAELALEPEALPTGWPAGTQVLTWERLLAAYQPVAPAYWTAVLREALARYEELKAPRRPGRHNADGLLTGQSLVDGYQDGTLVGSWMGCGGGLDGSRLQAQLASGVWRTQRYEWRAKPLPDNRNWFPVADFAARIHDLANGLPAVTERDGEVGRWFPALWVSGLSPAGSPAGARISSPWRGRPAAPCQTVHAVLPHTAFRHRSPQRMRSSASHPSAEAIDPQGLQPRPGEAALPVAPVKAVLDAGEDRQTLVDVAVDLGELPRRIAVVEVATPAAQDAVEPDHHPVDRVAHIAPVGRLPDLGPDRRHRAVRRPSLQVVATSEPPRLHLAQVEAEEVDPLLSAGEADDPGLVGVQVQPQTGQDLGHPPARLLGVCTASAQHQEVVGVPHQHPEAARRARPFRIQHVERDVAQQRADRRALRGSRHGVGDRPVLQYPDPQPRPEQLQHPPITDPTGNLRQHSVVIDLPEAVPDIGVKHPLGAPVDLDPDGLKGLMGRAPGPKPVACRQEVGLEDRFEDQLRRGHRYPVAHARDRQRSGTTRLPRFWDMDPPQRRRPVRPGPKRCREVAEEGRHPGRLHGVDGHPIGAGRPSVCSHLVPGPAQDVAAGDLVVQGMEPALGLLLGTAVQHALQRTGRVQAIGPRGGPSPHRALTDPLPATPASMK
jgi:hypothetical protein